MKKNYIFSCLIAASVITGCIKEEGDTLLVQRQIGDSTTVSDVNGFFYGEAFKDRCIRKGFEPVFTAKKIHSIECFLELRSAFYNLNEDPTQIVACGYTWSETNENPVVTDTCIVVKVSDEYDIDKLKKMTSLKGVVKTNSTSNSIDFSQDSVSFSGTISGLHHDRTYYTKSFIINAQGDVAYNPQTLKLKTVTPSDIWYERERASLSVREGVIKFEVDGTVYFYGGRTAGAKCGADLWAYDVSTDSWTQKGTFSDGATNPYVMSERCHGAAFVSVGLDKTWNDANSKESGNHIVFFVGGENAEGTPIDAVFTYNVEENRFNEPVDHPNRRENIQKLPVAMTHPIAFELTTSGNQKYYYVGCGVGENGGAISNIYYYNPQFDRSYAEDETNKSSLSWDNAGNIQIDNKGEALGYCTAVKYTDNVVFVMAGQSGQSKTSAPSKKIYKLQADIVGYIEEAANGGPIEFTTMPEEMTARYDANAFYLEYDKEDSDGYTETFRKLYIGNGVDAEGNYLNDFWAYDMDNNTWSRCADCGNIARRSSISYVLTRTEDIFTTEFKEPQQRGYCAFGRGYNVETGSVSEAKLLNDVWEYLP